MIGSRIIFSLSIVLTMMIGYFDYHTGVHISMMLLYAVPILVSAWYCSRREGGVVAFAATASWLIVNLTNRPLGESDAMLSWNAVTRLGIFSLIAYSVSLQAQLRKALEREKLRADTDGLTGLLNKDAFHTRVVDEMNRARRYNHPLSLAFIDLDDFKLVNDLHGHSRGDRLLQQVSEAIIIAVRGTDIVGRIGGDEFAICFPETGEEQAHKAVDNLITALDIMTSQSGWQVTTSIGVITCPEVKETYEALLGKADKLMYQAKELGKNSAEFMTV